MTISRDTTTSALYVTVRDLEKSVIFKTVKITFIYSTYVGLYKI